MTLKEAKKILKKEGFHMALANKVIYQNGAIREFEKPEVCEAIKVANANRWTVGLSPIEWNEREARLKKEHEKHANASDKMGMTLKEAKDILKKEFAVIGIHKSTEPFEFDESRWIENEKPSVLEAFRVLSKEGYYITISGHDYNMREKRLKKEYEENTKDHNPGEELPKEGNHALKEAASQFNDALLDEQGKKIKRLGKEIARLNKIIHKKNEELRLTKIREKNLAELGLKYVGENEKLKKKIADKIVDEIDAQALKSAESALAYKEKVIAEKDDVIADLGKELAATKKELEEKTKLVETVRKGSKEYCEYGISAEKMIRKMANVIVYGKPVSSEDFKEYRRLANGYRYNPKLSDFSDEEEKKLEHAKKIRVSSDNAEEGADQSGKIVICGKDFGKLLKENEESAEELSKVLNDVIDQFLLFGEIIIKSEK